MESSYSKVDSLVTQSLAGLEEKRSLLEGLLWNCSPHDAASLESIQSLISSLEGSLPKLEQMALMEAPESVLDQIIRLTESIHSLLAKARDYLKSPSSPATQYRKLAR